MGNSLRPQAEVEIQPVKSALWRKNNELRRSRQICLY
jgi:hypothetical protein